MARFDSETVRDRAMGGGRRLAQVVGGRVIYHRSEAEATRQWGKIIQKFHYTPEGAESVVKISFHEDEKGWFIKGLLHPGCWHFLRPLQDFGLEMTLGDGRENWPVMPPRTMDEILMMPRSSGGRHWD